MSWVLAACVIVCVLSAVGSYVAYVFADRARERAQSCATDAVDAFSRAVDRLDGDRGRVKADGIGRVEDD